MGKSYVGVLLNRRFYQGIRSGRTGHEALLQYVIMGERYGVTPCFLQLGDIRPGSPKVAAYVLEDWEYRKKMIPMPAVVHNRAIYKEAKAKRKIEQIARSGTRIFNRCTRYGKRYIHKLLMENEELRVHMPETMPATARSIRDMMIRHNELIVKPNNGSIGKGIMMLGRGEDGRWQLRYRLKSKKKVSIALNEAADLPAVLLRRIRAKRYLVQQRLPLAKYQGRPFDIRVSVQRDHTGDWQVTGMVGKAAAARSFLTNVAQGGEVFLLEHMLDAFPTLNPDRVKEGICSFSLRVAEQLSRTLPELADIGLDIGITEDGFPMFIECNGRDLRYSFLKGGMVEEWTNTYGNPLGYAAYLMNRKALEN